MPTLTITYETESERLAYEQAIAFVTQMHQLAQNAPSGTVMDVCERMTLADGRQLLRNTLRAAVQERIEQAEEKKGRHAAARVGDAEVTKENGNAAS